MNIKSKLILAFLSVSLISLTMSSSVLYFYAKKYATVDVLDHLKSVASIQRTRIQGLYQQNMERLNLVASRTQLRISLDKHNQTGEIKHQDKMNRIIADVRKSITDFKTILILSLDGKVVAATDKSRINQDFAASDVFNSGKKQGRADFFQRDKKQNLMVQLSGPLYLKEKLLGVLLIESAVNTMMSSVSDYTGLGETGETILASRNHQGDAVFIMPTRFNKNAALILRISNDKKNAPMIHAVNGDEILFESSIDYRGEEVLSVTRYIEDAKWGLAVKIDKREAFLHLTYMRNMVLIVIFISGIFIIFLSLFIARHITRPIIQLTDTARQIINGDLSVQANETSSDEVGLLGKTFNLMTASLHKEQNNLKQSEQALINSQSHITLLLDSTAEGIYGIDTDGLCTFANQACLDILGYEKDTELLGKNMHSLIHYQYADGSDYPVEKCHIYQAFKENKGTHIDDEVLWRKDGNHFTAEYWSHPIIKDQLCVGAVVTFMDITKRKDAEHKNLILVQSLEDKNAELERFTYTVSHDLKSPLVTISGFIGLLKKDMANNNQERIASDFIKINNAANTMQNLLNDLLELSRIGRQASTRSDVSIANIVSSVLDLLAANIKTSGAKITVADDLPVVHVEETRFKEVYLNLIENAIKYCPDDVIPEITIGVKYEQNNNEMVFFVKDNGLGIDSRYQEKIFDLFERLSNDNEGTGVGLAIVKRIIDVHNGRIWVESAGVGQGSSFNFVISPTDSK